MKKIICIFLFCLVNTIGYSQCNTIMWSDTVSRYCSCSNTTDGGDFTAMMIDNDEYVYGAGYKLVGYMSSSSGYHSDNSFFVNKYDSAGNVIWRFQNATEFFYYNRPSIRLSVDDAKNVFMSFSGKFPRYFWSTQYADSVYYLPQQQGTLCKIDSLGHANWATATYGLYGTTNLQGVSYIAGEGDTIEKIDSSGNLIWLKTFSAGARGSKRIKTDNAGNIIIIERNRITKLDSAGTMVWQNMENWPSSFAVTDYVMQIDSADNIYAVGKQLLYKITPAGVKTVLSPPYMQVSRVFPIKNSRIVVNNYSNTFYMDINGTVQKVYQSGGVYADHNENFYTFTRNQMGSTAFYLAWAAITKYHSIFSNGIATTGSPTVCVGDTVTVYSIEPGSHTYQWYKNNIIWPGYTTQQIIIDSLGWYPLRCIIDSNLACPSNTITVGIEPGLTNGPVTEQIIRCDETVLTTASNASWYLWYRNDTLVNVSGSNSYTAQINGNYTVIDSNACGVLPATDTIAVQIHGHPSSGINQKRYDFCEGSQVTLTANAGYSWYRWSNNLNTLHMGNVFTVDTTRSFVVLTISDSLNCQTSEIFQFYEHVFNPFQNSYSQFCDGDSVTLNAGSAYTSYLWSTGDTTQTITLFNNQDISVTTTDTIGCVGVDSVNINKITLTIPILTYDSLTCTLYLDSMGAGYYVWVNNTGAFAINTPSVVVPGQGSYHVQYSNYGCMVNTDTMNINCSPVGFDEINTIQNTIFITNPVRDKIFIYWKNTLPDNLVICLTDATGKEIKRANATNGTAVINMQAAAKGIYFLKLLNAEKQEFAVKKIVKVD